MFSLGKPSALFLEGLRATGAFHAVGFMAFAEKTPSARVLSFPTFVMHEHSLRASPAWSCPSVLAPVVWLTSLDTFRLVAERMDHRDERFPNRSVARTNLFTLAVEL